MRCFRFFLLAAIFLPAVAPAFLVQQLNLEQLTVLADKIFIGRCEEVRSGRDQNGRAVDTVTFKVSETLKGEPSERVTFRQIVLVSTDRSGKLSGTTMFSDLPRYEPEEEVVLFLSAPSEWGLTAPIGLLQGKFVVQKDGQGKKFVTNGVKNRGLLLGLTRSPRLKAQSLTRREKGLLQKSGEKLPLDDFVSLVKKLSP